MDSQTIIYAIDGGAAVHIALSVEETVTLSDFAGRHGMSLADAVCQWIKHPVVYGVAEAQGSATKEA